MPVRSAIVVLGLILMASCVSGPSSPLADAATMVASISGTVVSTYSGGAQFTFDGQPRTFAVNSWDTVARGSVLSQSLLLWRQGESAPSARTYTLAPPEYAKSEWPSFAATYVRTVGDVAEQYVALNGEVRLTSVLSDRVRGDFRFMAQQICSRSASSRVADNWGVCTPSSRPPGDGRVLELSGSFVATRPSNARLANP